MSLRLLLAALLLALATAACSSTPSEFQDVRDALGQELNDQGVPRDEVTCALDAYEAEASGEQLRTAIEAFAEDDVDGIQAVAASVGAAGRLCFSQESIAALTEGADIEDVREGFILGFQQTADSTREEAACVFDELVDRGVTMAQLNAGATTPEVQAALQEAIATCIE